MASAAGNYDFYIWASYAAVIILTGALVFISLRDLLRLRRQVESDSGRDQT